MPEEPAADIDASRPVDVQVEDFNQEFGASCPVSVLNTTELSMRQQLVVWNQEFAVPNWAVVNGQRATLDALLRFAAATHVHVRVFFRTWNHALEDLVVAISGSASPDVAQIGSTWVGYLSDSNALLHLDSNSQDPASRMVDTSGTVVGFRYITDARLLVFWTRQPYESVDAPPLDIDPRSWNSILESLRSYAMRPRSRPAPPIVMPVGLTQNVLHDLTPLVRAGGSPLVTGKRPFRNFDLASKKALATALDISAGAIALDGNGLPHRLVSFPEMTHEEAVQALMRGEFIASVEPVAFLKRWWRDWTKGAKPRPAADFWSHVGAVAPPHTFKGGSDLVALSKSRHPKEAEALAFFLTHDAAFARKLAEAGNLPPGAVDAITPLFESMGIAKDSTQKEIVVLRNAVTGALVNGEEYPSIPEWPQAIERGEVLEALQTLWRRIGDHAGERGGAKDIESAAHNAEELINTRLNLLTRVTSSLVREWPVVALLALVIAGVSMRELRHAKKQIDVERQRADALEHARKSLSERAEALEQVKTVRGFAAHALVMLDSVHNLRPFNPFRGGHATPGQADKALIVAAGLRGWRRGQEATQWEPCRLVDVIWRALLLAIDTVVDPATFSSWERRAANDTISGETFLRERGLTREGPDLSPGSPPFYFEVDCPSGVYVSMPFMLEQALVCVLQNAMLASRDESGRYSTIRTFYESASNSVRILNFGRRISRRLETVINHSKSVEEFEGLVDHLLRGPATHRPGIGLVEAYCIAGLCYGGLRICGQQSEISIALSRTGSAK
jgi:ABC-type glycerol-3-phosphate transport system substrate-binding protein